MTLDAEILDLERKARGGDPLAATTLVHVLRRLGRVPDSTPWARLALQLAPKWEALAIAQALSLPLVVLPEGSHLALFAVPGEGEAVSVGWPGGGTGSFGHLEDDLLLAVLLEGRKSKVHVESLSNRDARLELRVPTHLMPTAVVSNGRTLLLAGSSDRQSRGGWIFACDLDAPKPRWRRLQIRQRAPTRRYFPGVRFGLEALLRRGQDILAFEQSFVRVFASADVHSETVVPTVPSATRLNAVSMTSRWLAILRGADRDALLLLDTPDLQVRGALRRGEDMTKYEYWSDVLVQGECVLIAAGREGLLGLDLEETAMSSVEAPALLDMRLLRRVAMELRHGEAVFRLARVGSDHVACAIGRGEPPRGLRVEVVPVKP